MFRKFLSLVALMAVAFAVLPLSVASAAFSASAGLSASSVLPGAGQSFTVTVTNNESALFGIGNNIEKVRVTPPALLVGDSCPALESMPAGWTCTSYRDAYFVFESAAGLTPGSSVGFTFTGDIDAPLNEAKSQDFRVAYTDSTTGGSYVALPNLPLTVRILAVVPGSIVETAGDGIVTAGQTFNGSYQLRSYARQSVTVSPTIDGQLQGPLSLDGIGAAAAGSFKDTAGAFSQATAETQTRVSTKQVSITATDNNGSNVGPLTGSYQIQGNAYLQYVANSVQPAEVRSRRTDANGNYVGGWAAAISLDVDKRNIPLVAGASVTLTLDGPGGPYGPVAGTFNWNGSTPWGENARATLDFDEVVVAADVDLGVLNGTLTLTGGTDSNGYPYSQTMLLPGLIDIDNVAPLLLDTLLSIPSNQDQVKAGDTVTLSGRVDDPQDNAVLPDMLDLSLRIQDDRQFPPVEVGTIQVADSDIQMGSNDSFSANVVLPDLPALGTLFADFAIADGAGNGNSATANVRIDNDDPDLAAARIVPNLDPATGNPKYDNAPVFVVEAELSNDFGAVDGGCSPTNWHVDGVTLTAVYFSNGTRCTPGVNDSAAPDSIRVLIPSEEINENVSRVVEFNPNANQGLLTNNITDGALNVADITDIATITVIQPPQPVFNLLTRYDTDIDDGSHENAIAYGDVANRTFYVNRGGADGQATTPQLTVGRADAAFQIIITDQSGNEVYRNAAPSPDGEDELETIPLPIPADAATCTGGTLTGQHCTLTRKVFYYNPFAASGVQYSDPLALTVILDQTIPAIAGESASGDNATVTVNFTEALAGGNDAPDYWAALQRNADYDNGEGQEEYVYFPAFSVTAPNANNRNLDVQMDAGPLAGVSYLFTGQSILDRYEDLAGNRINPDILTTP